MLVKYNGVYEEIESIHTDEDNCVAELESLRNNYALTKRNNFKWKIDVIELNNIK